MGKPYSSDLRERILRHIKTGNTRRNAAARFGVSPSFAIKLNQGSRQQVPQRQPRKADRRDRGRWPISGIT
jgi:transposase